MTSKEKLIFYTKGKCDLQSTFVPLKSTVPGRSTLKNIPASTAVKPYRDPINKKPYHICR